MATLIPRLRSVRGLLSNPSDSIKVVHDVACTLCGCVCDDLSISVRQGAVHSVNGACELARPFLLALREHETWPVEIEGSSASLDDGINAAARTLAESKAPLIYGLSRSSTAGQRAATRLADQLGATIDTTASRCHAPSIMALQQVGESTCSLGEARHHCDLVLFWGSNPAHSHPRHGERYSMNPSGQFLPNGREDRTVVVVDVKKTATTEQADVVVDLELGSDFDAIWVLRALVNDIEIDRWPAHLPRQQLEHLAHLMKSCRSGIVYFGLGLTRYGVPHSNVEALLQLVTDLNAHTRFYARRMRIPGDVAGADSVLCWQTGFPFSVNLARGYPRYNPGEYSANELLERGEVDCVVLVGSEGVGALSEQAQARLDQLPTIVLDYPTQPCSFVPHVRFTTAVYGVHVPGTAYRMDEVPIPLRAFLPCGEQASDAEVLKRLAQALEPG